MSLSRHVDRHELTEVEDRATGLHQHKSQDWSHIFSVKYGQESKYGSEEGKRGEQREPGERK